MSSDMTELQLPCCVVDTNFHFFKTIENVFQQVNSQRKAGILQ